jgi:opacity protein-like surface antigen
MRRIAFFILSCLVCAAATGARAQVSPSAYRGQLTLTAGGLGSAFQPDYEGGAYPSSSSQWLLGFGAYADLQATRWLGAEAEARWLRLNTFVNINEDNYVVGPRVPIHEFKRLGATPYGKALFGVGRMNFEYGEAHGRVADIALGGGVDLKVSKRWSVRACDFEYQFWPNWINGTLKPYGVSAGIGYRIF